MLTLPTKIKQLQTQHLNDNIVNLSFKQESELLACLSYNHFTNKAIKHKLIKYAKMFINNKMSYDLCEKLLNITQYNNLFRTKEIRIKGESYLIFYIDDFVCLINITDAPKNNIFAENYSNTTELNSYTLAYSVREQFVLDTIAYPENDEEYISFMLYKDNMIYSKNDFYSSKELNTSIFGTTYNIIKNIGITKKELEDCLNSLFILNALRK